MKYLKYIIWVDMQFKMIDVYMFDKFIKVIKIMLYLIDINVYV